MSDSPSHDDTQLGPDDLVIRDLLRAVPEDLDREVADQAVLVALEVGIPQTDAPNNVTRIDAGRSRRWLPVAAAIAVVCLVSVSGFMALRNSGSGGGVETADVATVGDRAGSLSTTTGPVSYESGAPGEDSFEKSTESARDNAGQSAGSNNSGPQSPPLSSAPSVDESTPHLRFGGSFASVSSMIGSTESALTTTTTTAGLEVAPPEVTNCAQALTSSGHEVLEWVLVDSIPALVTSGSPTDDGSSGSRSIFRADTCTLWAG